MKKKIAIGIFGIPRASEYTFESIDRCVIQQASIIGEVKLFGHLFKLTDIENSRSGEKGFLHQSNYDKFTIFNPKIESPFDFLKNYPFEKVKSFGDIYLDNFKSVTNLMHQLHSLKVLTAEMKAYEPDVVIYIRPDILYHQNIPLSAIEKVAKSPGQCFIPAWQWWAGYNDRFSIAGKDSYESYGNRIDNALIYCVETNRPLHAERLLRYSLKKNDVAVRIVPTTASRIRIDGQVADEGFNPLMTVGSRKLLLEIFLRKILTMVK